MALEGLLGRGEAGRLQHRLVGPALALPGGVSADSARPGRLRPRGQVSRAGQRPLHEVFPRPHPAVPVPPRALPGRGPDGAALPLLHLRQQGGGREAGADAGHGPEPPLAGRPGGAHRRAAHGRGSASRVLRAALEVAGRAEPGERSGLVRRKHPVVRPGYRATFAARSQADATWARVLGDDTQPTGRPGPSRKRLPHLAATCDPPPVGFLWKPLAEPRQYRTRGATVAWLWRTASGIATGIRGGRGRRQRDHPTAPGLRRRRAGGHRPGGPAALRRPPAPGAPSPAAGTGRPHPRHHGARPRGLPQARGQRGARAPRPRTPHGRHRVRDAAGAGGPRPLPAAREAGVGTGGAAPRRRPLRGRGAAPSGCSTSTAP